MILILLSCVGFSHNVVEQICDNIESPLGDAKLWLDLYYAHNKKFPNAWIKTDFTTLTSYEVAAFNNGEVTCIRNTEINFYECINNNNIFGLSCH